MSMARNPELQLLLASLNGTAVPAESGTESSQSVQNRQLKFKSSSEKHNGAVFSNEYNPGHIPSLGFAQAELSTNTRTTAERSIDPRKRPGSNSTLSVPQNDAIRSRSTTPLSQDIPDASGIITWPAALKHVTKHIVPNEKISSRIKHLISEQHKHERQWWAQREAIIARHQGRSGNQVKAAELLKSIGGLSVPIAKIDPKSDQAEIEAFDRKVYKSLTQMVADFDGQLRKMNVPFYAIRHDLVILEVGQEKQGATKGRLDKGELRELQKRILETLEDLFGEDEGTD